MKNRLRRFQNVQPLVLGTAALALFSLACAARAQSTAAQDTQAAPGVTSTQDRQAAPGNGSMNDDAMNQDRRADQSEAVNFDRFLDQHREIGEQVRKDPSLCDNRDFLQSHPALESYLRDHPGVREQLRQDPNAFMRLADRDNRDLNRDGGQNGDAGRGNEANQDRNADQRDALSFDRFLDSHREIGEQVRKDPSLCDNRNFVNSHPALQAYLQQNPGVRDQLRQDPNAFMRLADRDNREMASGRDAMHDHMADFGGWLGNHPDIRRDVSRDPNCIKDHQYLEEHAELQAYLSAHPDVRNDWISNPQDFVHGAQQYSTGSGTGVYGRGTGTTGSGTSGMSGTTGTSATGTSTGTSTTPAATPHDDTKPNQ
jgi:hypothetical protein